MKVSSVEQMRRLDQTAVDTFGIPFEVLMENAGLAAAFVLQQELDLSGKRVVVVCGPGNNGGDGFVVARKLRASRRHVHVFVLGDPTRYTGAARTNFLALTKSGARIDLNPEPHELDLALAHCHAAVDALLGTGITRDVSGPFADAIAAFNRCGRPILSLDIPSGICGNTGAVRGAAVRAAITVTFGLPKRGNLLYPGAAYGGRLFLSPISFPPALQDTDEIDVHVSMPTRLPPRPAHGHKGTFGDALFVAGAAGYFGAPALSAAAMLRAGGGYARLAAPRSITPALASIAHELVFLPQDETPDGAVALRNLDSLVERSRTVDFVVVGPGLSLQTETQELVRRLASSLNKPLLIDGDGLTAVAGAMEVLAARTAPTVLTPHAGEMSRLLGVTSSEVLADPIAAVRRAAAEAHAHVVLKGAHSLIATPDGAVFINTSGNAGMATAGSGDVLAGTIAAMAGLGLPIEHAVRTGVFVHGLAGDLASKSIGQDGVIARDILEHLPEATRMLRERFDEVSRDECGAVRLV